MTEVFERQRAVLRLHNEFTRVLARMTEDNRDPYINRSDFRGTLGGTEDYSKEFLMYCRVILRTWYMLNTYRYLYGLITKQEYAMIRQEYKRKDRQFWEDGPYSCYRDRKALSLL